MARLKPQLKKKYKINKSPSFLGLCLSSLAIGFFHVLGRGFNMHIRTKLFAMMIFAALASAGLIFGLFFFLQKETS
ncbi:MAG: hypothetical protein VXY43_02110, partial [Pseudomonadota bacterium]|nr:hypothetical protein [Pseudomonadota bacterium]